MSHQTRANVNTRDNVRHGSTRPFDDERMVRNLAIGTGNITSIGSFNQAPLVTTTITTKHYPTEAELKATQPKAIDLKRKEEYQKLVEKHQQDLLKRKDLQQHHYHHHQQLQRQQLLDHEFGIQLKRNQHGDDDDDQKRKSGVRLTGIYPPEYFENNYDDFDDVDGDDEVEYYLPPPPLEFSSSPHLKADEIVAIPPPEHYNHSHFIPSHHLKAQGALKKDNTNLKLFVTTATFSPAKSSTRMNHSGTNVQHQDDAKRFTSKEPITAPSRGNDLPRYNTVGLSEGCMKSDKNHIDPSTSNTIIGDSSENQKQIRSETSDTSKLKSSNAVSSKQLIAKGDRPTDRISTDLTTTTNQPEPSQPPVLIRRLADKKGDSSQKSNITTQEVMKDKTEREEKMKDGVSVEETSRPNKQRNGFERNSETADRNISTSPHELSTSNPFRRSIEIRTETTSDFPLKKSNSIKYKIDAKPPAHSKSSVEKAAPPQGSLLPTPELKIEYVSKSPRTSCSEAPSESPNEKSKSKSFFSTAWKKNASTRREEKQQNEVKKSSSKLSNTQKFLNLLNVKNSPNLPFKSQKNKVEENKGRKARKKSLDLIDRKKPLFHSTPPPRMRLRSGLEENEEKTPSPIEAKPNTGQTFKKGAELMVVELDADGMPTKHLILSPPKHPQSNDGSRASSPRHSRQNSDGSAVFPSDLTTSIKSEQIPSQHFVIVAIDFGTTFSGYAFCFIRDPDSVHIMRRWEGGDPGLVNQKTLTTLLLDPQGNFHSFGFTARDAYHDLDEEQARKWFYFEKFKMALHHNAELNKDTTIKASNGKPFPALKVFSYALKYFKDHALQELTDQSETNIYNEDIRWVLTVPAIWKAPAKQFMRQAAYQAGIATPENPNQLMIALEPEAASIYVRKLRIYQLVPESSSLLSTSTLSTDTTPRKKAQNGAVSKGNFFNDVKYQTLPTSNKEKEFMSPSSSMATVGQEVDVDGTRYMVVDCGGGTVDITVHEMEANGGSLKELHKATGGPYGSIGIDHEFEKLLVRIFGPEFVDSFKLKRPSGWVDLMTAFESRKRSAHPGKENSLNVALPFSLIEFYKKNKGSSVESAIKKFGNKEITWSSQGMLRLTPSAMRKLFQPTIDNIVKAVGDVLNCTTARGVKYLFLVGGFAESGILQTEMKREFGHLLKIVIPQDVGTTILKGAVCFGLDPTVVSERRCRMTYGVGVLNKFIDGVHPPSKLVVKDGIRWCVDVLDKFVVADQPVAFGDSVVRSYAPARAGQRSSVIHIYSSERADATFVTDAGVTRCGTLCLDSNDNHYRHTMSGTPLLKSRRSREIQARMTFGDTEIKVSAVDVATGKCVKSTIDFLGR